MRILDPADEKRRGSTGRALRKPELLAHVGYELEAKKITRQCASPQQAIKKDSAQRRKIACSGESVLNMHGLEWTEYWRG